MVVAFRVQETTTIIGSTTYLRKAGLSRKHLLLASSLFVFFFFLPFVGSYFGSGTCPRPLLLQIFLAPPSPPRQLGAKWPSWIGCVLLYRRNLHCFFFLFPVRDVSDRLLLRLSLSLLFVYFLIRRKTSVATNFEKVCRRIA